MKNTPKYFVILLFVIANHFVSFSQITTTNAAPYNTTQNLVNNVLLGQGVSASNITSLGQGVQRGFFNGMNSNIGLDSGLVLTSGDIASIPPNGFGANPGMQTTTPAGIVSDLLRVSNTAFKMLNLTNTATSIHDMTVIEFDFVVTGDTLEFNYVFGSNEYLTYVNSQYNDIFGFFLYGPGITPTDLVNNTSGNLGADGNPDFSSYVLNGTTYYPQNIASVPNTNPPLPITISSIHPNLNSQYYINNPAPAPTVNINGFTTKLTARAIVQCGQTYHIRLAVSDVADGILDTQVFLEGGSFTSSGSVTISPQPPNILNGPTNGADTALYEGCGPVNLILVRTGDTTQQSGFQVTYSGTATNGADYMYYDNGVLTAMPDSIIFMPGQDTLVISFMPVSDSTFETTESMIISVTGTFCTTTSTVSTALTISDYIPVATSTVDTTVNCLANSVPIGVQALGIPPLMYAWNTGDTSGTIAVNPGNTTTIYYVTVTDGCNMSSNVDSVIVSVINDSLIITVSEDDTINCLSNPIPISVTVSSGISPYTYLWSPGSSANPAIAVKPATTTDYIITVTDACGVVTATDTITVFVINDTLEIFTSSPPPLNCISTNADISVFVSGGITPATYLWNTGETSFMINVSPNSTTIYSVTVTDACGMDTEVGYSAVTVLDSAVGITANDVTLACAGHDITIQASPVSGYAPYEIWWDNGVLGTSQIVNPDSTASFTVYATDVCKLDTDSVVVTVYVTIYDTLKVFAGNDDTLHCPGDVIAIHPTAQGGSGGYVFTWNNSQQDSLIDNPAITTTYVVGVTDNCPTGTAYDTITIFIPEYDPLMVITKDTIINSCPGDRVDLVAKAIGGDSVYVYSWSNLAGNRDSVAVFPASTDNYTIFVTDGCNNTSDFTVTVSIVPPDAGFEFDFRADNNVLFENASLYADTFLWKFGDGGISSEENPSYSYVKENEYEVTLIATSEYGCVDSVKKKIIPPLEIWLPGAFTPNGDGINDVFEVFGIGIKKYEIRIFDRWGELIFQSDNILNSWDGKTKGGQLLQTAAFAYHIKATGISRERFEKRGTVTILR